MKNLFYDTVTVYCNAAKHVLFFGVYCVGVVNMHYKQRLKNLVAERGQIEVSNMLNISQPHLCRMVKGNVVPKVNKLLLLAEVVDMDLKDLIVQLSSTEEEK